MFKFIAALLLAVALASPVPASAQAANQLMNGTQVQAAINAGTFVLDNGACNFGGYGLEVVQRAIFVECIANNGACASTGTYLNYGQMLACKTSGVTPPSYTRESFTYTGSTSGTLTHTSTTTVSISNGTYPVSYEWSTSGTGTCVEQLTVGGTVIASGNTGSVSGTYTGGATGTMTFTLSETHTGTCTVAAGGATYYH